MKASTPLTWEGEALARFVNEAMKETDVESRSVPRTVAAADADVVCGSSPGTVQRVRVGGIAAAVPLTDIAGVSRYSGAPPERITCDGRRLRVVTPARVLGGAAISDGGYLLVCAGVDLALPCDALEGRREVGPADLRLRRGGVTRPWVSGVMNDERRCLLNLPALFAALVEDDGTEAASDFPDGSERQNSDTNRSTENMR